MLISDTSFLIFRKEKEIVLLWRYLRLTLPKQISSPKLHRLPFWTGLYKAPVNCIVAFILPWQLKLKVIQKGLIKYLFRCAFYSKSFLRKTIVKFDEGLTSCLRCQSNRCQKSFKCPVSPVLFSPKTMLFILVMFKFSNSSI